MRRPEVSQGTRIHLRDGRCGGQERGPYVMNTKASTQRNGFKVEIQTLKVGNSEAAGEALFRVDRKGTPTIVVNADIVRLDAAELKAAPVVAAPAAASQAPVQPPRLIIDRIEE